MTRSRLGLLLHTQTLRLVALLFPALAWGQTPSAQVELSIWAHGLSGASSAGAAISGLSTNLAPSSQCNWSSITTAFICDLTHMGLGIGLQTTNQSLGRPTSGYTLTYNYAALGAYCYTTAPWNQDIADNGGRNGQLCIQSKVDNYSTNGGDAFGYHFDVGAFATKATATNFLASTAVSGLAGSVNAFTNGVYLQGIGDINLYDQGSFDAAAIGVTMNFKRNVATGNLNSNWIWLNAQSAGSLPMDAEERFYGPVRFTFDLTNQSYPDQTLVTAPVLVGGGSGYTACTVTGGVCSGGSVLTVQGGTCDQPTTLEVTGVSGGVITTVGVERAGMCSSPPGNPVSVVDSKGGTLATFNLQYTGTANPYMVTPANTYWYANGTNDISIWNTKFPSTTLPGTTYHGFSSSLQAWNMVVNNVSALQVGSTLVITPVQHQFNKGFVSTGGATTINASSNFSTSIGTGTTTSNVFVGGTANATNVGSPLNLTTAGALSANSWTTSGLVLSGTGQTLTDATGSGTITTEAAAALPVYTIAATNPGVTITNLDELFLPVPAAGTNITATNLYSLHTGGAIKVIGSVTGFGGANISGAAVSLNNSSNFPTNIGSGTTTSAVNIGNSANITNLGPNETNNGTAFTAATATGCSVTNGTPGTISGGPQGGTMVGNSNGTGCTFVITVNGATGSTVGHAWTCYGSDVTTAVALAQSGSSTTQCTLKGTINANTDTIAFHIDGN